MSGMERRKGGKARVHSLPPSERERADSSPLGCTHTRPLPSISPSPGLRERARPHFHLAQKGGKEESIRSEEVPISLWACTPPLLSVPLGAKSRRRRQGKGEERSGQFFIPYPTSEAAGSPPLNLRRTGVPRGVFSFCAAANLNLAPLDLDGVSLHHSPFSRRNSFSFSISSWSAIF